MTFLVPLSSISLSDLERRYVLEALDSGMFSSAAPQVAAFERAIAAAVGCPHAVSTNSGTSALELIILAMGIGAGDEVIVPAFTFAAPALAVARAGATPVFADIATDSWTLDPAAAARAITPRTRAIIAVDVLGHPCDYDALEALGPPVIEDAAEAFGARYKDRAVGGFGAAAVFSLHANKVVSAGEGGCIVTRDAALAARTRKINMFGMDPARRYWHTDIGCNNRMSGLVAAVALGQLERAETLIEGRRRVARRYDAALSGLPLERRPVAPWAWESPWLYTVAVEDPEALVEGCQRRGVDARAVWPVLPDSPAFDRFPGGSSCPVARRVAGRAVWLPTWSDMPEESVDLVVDAVRAALAG